MLKTIEDYKLLEFTRCPLRLAAPAKENPIDKVAASLVRSVSAVAYEGSVPSLRHLRGQAEALYKAEAGDLNLTACRNIVRLCRRVHTLFLDNEVLYPETAYYLDIGGITIEGSITILRSPRRPRVARVLRLRPRGTLQPVMPDVVSLSRWLYALRESGHSQAVVHNYWTLDDLSVSQEFSEAVAQRWLSIAATAYAQRRAYPAPGPHCQGCRRPCMELKLWNQT